MLQTCLLLVILAVLGTPGESAAITNCVPAAATPADPWCLNPTAGAGGCGTALSCDDATQRCKETFDIKDFMYSKATRSCVNTADCTDTLPATIDAYTKTSVGPLVACTTGTVPDSTGKGALKCHVCSADSNTGACVAAKTGVPTGTGVGGNTVAAASACTACWTKVTFTSGVVVGATGVITRGCHSSSTAAPTASFNWATKTGDLVQTCNDAMGCNNYDLNFQILAPPSVGSTSAPCSAGAQSTASVAVMLFSILMFFVTK